MLFELLWGCCMKIKSFASFVVYRDGLAYASGDLEAMRKPESAEKPSGMMNDMVSLSTSMLWKLLHP